MISIPTIETDRLILRAFKESDLANFAKFQMDKVAARFVSPCNTVSEAWREMAYMAGHWLLRGFGNWSLERKDTSQHIGRCGTYFPEGWPEPEIGWSIYPEHQRQGFATEAAIAAISFAYGKLNWKTAISLIANENAPSIALARRLGAVYEAPFFYKGVDCSIYRHLTPQQFQTHSKEKMKWH